MSTVTKALTRQEAEAFAARRELARLDASGVILRGAAEFGLNFPAKTGVGQRYEIRTWPGFVNGCNVGWTNGFWTGLLWLAYEDCNDELLRLTAESHLDSYAQRLDSRTYIDHHDMGFLYTPSCVTSWRLTGNEKGRSTAVKAAEWLMTRYLKGPGIIQAWGDLEDPAQRGRIIVDCLLNLPLLHWASAATGEPRFAEAAVSHARQSARHLLRNDDSTFHTYHFDPVSGRALSGSTAQGWHDESCWSRGQAWAIYGFALNHSYAPDEGFLTAAMRAADYFLRYLPEDGVAYWDLSFSDGSSEPRDSSAAAIAVCGLLEIADHLPAGPQSTQYRAAALRILDSLVTVYRTDAIDRNALLMHAVYSKPHDQGIDAPCLWGDYFYLEALMRLSAKRRIYW